MWYRIAIPLYKITCKEKLAASVISIMAVTKHRIILKVVPHDTSSKPYKQVQQSSKIDTL